jgi:H+/Cl- antiporter ClcA
MPAPWVSLLICVECCFLKADEDGNKLELFGRRTLFLLGIAATLAFVVRFQVKEIPLMPDLDELAKHAGTSYDNTMVFKAILLGAIAAVAAISYAIIQGVTKAVFTKIGSALQNRCGQTTRIIAMCSLAGLLTGVLGYIVPLSLASGKESMMPTMMHSSELVKFAHGVELSTVALLWIAVAKTASFSIASAGGMVGGPFFPILYIGVVVGEMCARIPITWCAHPAAFTVPVVMVAVPSAVFPIPFTMVSMPLSYFHLGPRWCVPILAGIITSYTLVVGTGLVKALAKK